MPRFARLSSGGACKVQAGKYTVKLATSSRPQRLLIQYAHNLSLDKAASMTTLFDDMQLQNDKRTRGRPALLEAQPHVDVLLLSLANVSGGG